MLTVFLPDNTRHPNINKTFDVYIQNPGPQTKLLYIIH